MPFDTKELGAALKKVPWWGYAGGGGVVLALGYYIHKQMSSSSASSTTGPGTAASTTDTSAADQGLNMSDLAGMPFDSFDPGYNSDPYANQSNPSGYDPYIYPPSGSPPEEILPYRYVIPPAPQIGPPMGTPVFPGYPVRTPAPQAPPRTGPTPTRMPAPQAPVNVPVSPNYWSDIHAWPAFESGRSNIEGALQ